MAAACCGMQVDSDSDFAFLHLISEFPKHEPECQSGFKFARPSLLVELPVRSTRRTVTRVSGTVTTTVTGPELQALPGARPTRRNARWAAAA